MAKSYETRLNGNTQQFIEDVGVLGVWGAMEKYGLKDYLSVRKFILDKGKDENYGLNPKLGPYYRGGLKAILQELVASFADYAIRKDKRIELLERQLEAYRDSQEKTETEIANEVLSVAEALRASK
jgi:hypothetical protein